MMNRAWKRGILLGIGFCWVSIAHADMIAQLDLVHVEDDGASVTNRVNGNYYFSPVATNSGPLLLATFLQRADSVGLSYEHQGDRNSYQVDGLYSHDKTGWFVSGSVTESRESSAQNLAPILFAQSESRQDTFAVTVGKYIFRTTTLGVGFTRNSSRLHTHTVTTLGSISTFDANIDTDTNELDIRVHHFGYVMETGYELTGDCARASSTTASSGNVLAFGTDERISRCSVGARLFALQTLSFGASYRRINATTVSRVTGLSIEWFPAHAWLISLAYDKIDYSFTPILVTPVTPALTSLASARREIFTIDVSARF